MINFYLPTNKHKMIDALISHHKKNLLPRYSKLYGYYKGEHAILNKQAAANTPNNRIVNPYPAFIVNTVQGYFLGQPVRYESKDGSMTSILYPILDANTEDDENVELAKTLSIAGEAYELVYMDEEAQIQFVQLPNDETIVHYSSSLKPKIDIALRYYEEAAADDEANPVRYVELYYADRIEYLHLSDDGYVLDDVQQHYFGEVPVIHYTNNKEQMGDFEIALPLIDDYDRTLSNNSNEFEYFRNAYLILKGFDGTTDEEIAEAVQKRAFKTSEEGDISFLTKEVNDSAVMNHLEVLNDNIHKACNIPNLVDESFAANLSGVALRYKLWGFENLISAKERKFISGLYRRLSLIVKALNIKGHSFDAKDITFRFERNLPANILENSQIVANLKDLIPIENLVTLLPFIEDTEEFLAAVEEQKRQNEGAAY